MLSLADFSNYYDPEKNKIDLRRFPALERAQGFETTPEHGDTLFMPGGFWHHMEYLDSGFAMSLRALQPSRQGKMKGLWNITGMRNSDTLMKKTMPERWYQYKHCRIFEAAGNTILS